MEQDKINAYMTLYTALVDIVQSCSSDDPVHDRRYLSEPGKKLDKDAPESIHLCDFPEVNEADDRQRSGSYDMDEVLKIVVMGRACRNTANIKNRQPIGPDVCKS